MKRKSVGLSCAEFREATRKRMWIWQTPLHVFDHESDVLPDLAVVDYRISLIICGFHPVRTPKHVIKSRVEHRRNPLIFHVDLEKRLIRVNGFHVLHEPMLCTAVFT